MEDTKQYAVKCFQDEGKAILDLIPLLTEDFSRAVEIMKNCKGKVICTGVGKSGHIGQKVAATLASTGTPAFFVNPLDAYHGDLGMFSEGDVVLMISNSGETEELTRIAPLLQARNLSIIVITGNCEGEIAKHADCLLNVSVKHEACPLNLSPTSSTTAMLAMGDALTCALMHVKHFTIEDYAKFHPGGELGKRLKNLRGE
ncbi:MAG TPA: hypothetical protein DDY68_03370 [Porphyromonadaceae bacterium]|nr:hypothetical protein [Porphyromonadaceae bacterium]